MLLEPLASCHIFLELNNDVLELKNDQMALLPPPLPKSFLLSGVQKFWQKFHDPERFGLVPREWSALHALGSAKRKKKEAKEPSVLRPLGAARSFSHIKASCLLCRHKDTTKSLTFTGAGSAFLQSFFLPG